MTLTLWRGELSLGELWRRLPPSGEPQPQSRQEEPPTLAALLIPTVPNEQLSGVWQLNIPHVGVGVRQHPVEPDIVAERAQRFAALVPNPGRVALRPMSDEEIRGVPADIQLTVRDTSGHIYLPLQVRLEEVRYSPELQAAALREVPAEALRDGSVWTVFIAFQPESDAPAI